jgi:hypothetical protein
MIRPLELGVPQRRGVGVPPSIETTSPLAAFDLLQAYGAVSGGTAWPTANLAIFIPVEIPYPYPLRYMAWLNGATVSGNADIGLYDSEGNRLVSSGSVAQASANAIQVQTLTTTLLKVGLYYMALAVDNTTATFSRWIPGVEHLRVSGVRQASSAFVLPATPTFAVPANAYLPRIAMGSRIL